MNCDEMAGNRLTVCEQELLYSFARLVSISSNFLYESLYNISRHVMKLKKNNNAYFLIPVSTFSPNCNWK